MAELRHAYLARAQAGDTVIREDAQHNPTGPGYTILGEVPGEHTVLLARRWADNAVVRLLKYSAVLVTIVEAGHLAHLY